MNVTKATVVLTRGGADLVILMTDNMPSPMPNVTKEPLSLTFYAEYNTGEKYVKTNFPNVPVNVIERTI